MTLTMVSLEVPCSGCTIVTNLMWETLAGANLPGVRVERCLFREPRQARALPGAEEGRFPILLLDGRPWAAGQILTREELMARLEASQGETERGGTDEA